MRAGNISKTGRGLVMVTLGKHGGEKGGKRQCRERRGAIAFLTGETCKERGGKREERGAGRGKGKEGETGRREVGLPSGRRGASRSSFTVTVRAVVHSFEWDASKASP